MSGHSKWNNIKRKKEKTDAAKASVFTRIGRELAVAVKEGGPDPASNSKLRDVIAKAKANNVPNDNIDRMLKKAAGETDKEYEEIVYEGYGPNGVAVVVETLTDNRNRTAGNVRLGQNGSVMFMFERKGIIIMNAEDLDEDTVMMDALDSGADDFNADGDIFEITTDPNDVINVATALQEKGYTFESAEAAYIPATTTALTDEEHLFKMNRMLDMMEEDDDIQHVWHSWAQSE